ncbi:MAG: nucleotidyltransferase domain-containing protein [Deltaproteobacteria bacterium]|nr:nucleotidyltransferase domain-containing protein [Deltaproteobacteria bacterium]
MDGCLFDTRDEFGALAEKYLGDAAARAEIAARLRAVVLENATYDIGLNRAMTYAAVTLEKPTPPPPTTNQKPTTTNQKPTTNNQQPETHDADWAKLEEYQKRFGTPLWPPRFMDKLDDGAHRTDEERERFWADQDRRRRVMSPRPARALTRGFELVRAGKHGGAWNAVAEGCRDESWEALALLDAARIAQGAGQTDAALVLLDRAERAPSKFGRAPTFLPERLRAQRAHILARAGRHGDAKPLVDKPFADWWAEELRRLALARTRDSAGALRSVLDALGTKESFNEGERREEARAIARSAILAERTRYLNDLYLYLNGYAWENFGDGKTAFVAADGRAQILASTGRALAASGDWFDGPTIDAAPCPPASTLKCLNDGGGIGDAVRRLKDLFETNEGLFTGVYLFASLSTGDYLPGASDVDSLAVLSEETALSPERLQRARDVLMRAVPMHLAVCPLAQHHTFVIPETVLSIFPATAFPPLLFEYAHAFVAPREKIALREAETSASLLASFRNHAADYFLAPRYPEGDPKRWAVKAKFMALHKTLSWPVHFLQARGEPCYKRESFERARRFFSPEIWKAVETAEALRRDVAKRAPSADVVRPYDGDPRDPSYFTERNAVVEREYRARGVFDAFDAAAPAIVETMRALSEEALKMLTAEKEDA